MPRKNSQLTNAELALWLRDGERRRDEEQILFAENAILARLNVSLDETEQGLTPRAAMLVDDFRDTFAPR